MAGKACRSVLILVVLLCILSAQDASALSLRATYDDGATDDFSSPFEWHGHYADDPYLDGADWWLTVDTVEPPYEWSKEQGEHGDYWDFSGLVSLRVFGAGIDFTGTGSVMASVEARKEGEYLMSANGGIDGGGMLDPSTPITGGSWGMPITYIAPAEPDYYNYAAAPIDPFEVDVSEEAPYQPVWDFHLRTSAVPEPCSAVLLALATGGAVLAARRRRRNRP